MEYGLSSHPQYDVSTKASDCKKGRLLYVVWTTYVNYLFGLLFFVQNQWRASFIISIQSILGNLYKEEVHQWW